MSTTTSPTSARPREAILAELMNLRFHAGRMTVKSQGYELTHDAINDLLVELGYPEP